MKGHYLFEIYVSVKWWNFTCYLLGLIRPCNEVIWLPTLNVMISPTPRITTDFNTTEMSSTGKNSCFRGWTVWYCTPHQVPPPPIHGFPNLELANLIGLYGERGLLGVPELLQQCAAMCLHNFCPDLEVTSSHSNVGVTLWYLFCGKFGFYHKDSAQILVY